MLVENSSFGHGSALLRLAFEEMAKALVCWYVSEGIFPAENNVIVTDVFRKHDVKNQIILAMCKAVFLGAMKKGERSPSVEEIAIADYLFKTGVPEMERLRQKAVYVDLNLRKKKIYTPEEVGEEETKKLLKAVETFYGYVEDGVTKFREADKKFLREFFQDMPDEVWKTGIIPWEVLQDKLRKMRNKVASKH